MTVVSLTYKRISLPRFFSPFQEMRSILISFHERFSKRLFLLGVLFLSTLIYLIAFYVIFSEGFQLQTLQKEVFVLGEDVAAIEFRVQGEQTALARDTEGMFKSMEKVSSVKYIIPENVAVSMPQTTP